MTPAFQSPKFSFDLQELERQCDLQLPVTVFFFFLLLGAIDKLERI
jgi:hypothetical protein